MARIVRENRSSLINKGQWLMPTPHLHKAVELIYIKSGNSTAYCDNKKYPLTGGSFFCVFPNQVHFYEDMPSDAEHLHYAVIVEPEQVPAFTDVFYNKVPETPVCIPDDPILENLIIMLQSETHINIKSRFTEGMLTAIFSRLFTHYRLIKTTTPNDRTSKILLYCNEHFREDISSDQVAAATYLSRGHISVIFNKTFGISFTDYINSLRIDEALRLVKSEKISITAAAARSGFATARTFNRAFFKKYGITPREYLAKP